MNQRVNGIYLIDNTDVSSCGFGRRPERRTTISKDQYSKLLKKQT